MVVRRRRRSMRRPVRRGRRPGPVNKTKRVRRAVSRGATTASRRGTKRRSGSVLSRPAKRVRFAAKRRYTPTGASSEFRVVPGIRQAQRKYGLQQLVQTSLNWRILRFQGARGLNRALTGESEGFYPMSCAIYADNTGAPVCSVTNGTGTSTFAAAGVTTNPRWLGTPVYLLDLTSTQNGGTPTSSPLYRLFGQIAVTSGDITWQWINCYGSAPSGSTLTKSWTTEDFSGTDSLGGYERDYIRPAYYDVRLMFRNATKQPTYFDTEFVSFAEDYLTPYNNSAFTSSEAFQRQAYLSGLVLPYISGNPILPKQKGSTYKQNASVRSWGRKRIYMKVQQSVDLDTSADVVTRRMFLRDGRVLNYTDRRQDAPTAKLTEAELTNPLVFDTRVSPSTSFLNTPGSTRSRRFLMIRALDPTRTASSGGEQTASDSQFVPSFDLVFRKKEHMGLVLKDVIP